MQSIFPNVYACTGLLMGRVYAIEDPDGLTIIDAGLDSAAGKVVKQLEAAGRKASDVKRILITHGHPDHVGGLPGLKAATGARVLASAEDRAAIEGREPSGTCTCGEANRASQVDAATPHRAEGEPVDQEIGEGETLPVLGGLQVLATPGHSMGHLAFWQPEKQVLFCGDVVFRLPWLRPPFAAFTVDMAQNDRSLKRLVDLNPSLVLFGHGQPLNGASGKLREYAHKRGVV